MKNMIKMLSVSIIALFSFMMITDAAIIEKDNYTEDTYIIGYSRFSGKSALTADMAAQAGQSYERIYSFLNMKDADKVQVFLKSELDGVWYTAKDGKPLSDADVKKLTENLMIFYVDEVEKTFEYTYSGTVDSDSLPTDVTYKNGKFTVPASKFYFDFKSNGNIVVVSTKVDYDAEEYVLGEFETELRLNPVVTLEIPETVLVGQSVEFTVKTESDYYSGWYSDSYLKFNDYSAIEKVEVKYFDNETSLWSWHELTNEGKGYIEGFNIGDEKTYKVTFKKAGNLTVNFELFLYESDESLVSATKSFKVNSGTDLKDAVKEQANLIKTNYYEKYNSQTINDVNEEYYYVNLGTYTGVENPDSLSIEGNEYSSSKIGSLSIGMNSFIEVPVWKIKDGNVLVALPWLAADSLPNGATTIKVGGQEISVYTYGSDAGKTLELSGGDVLFPKDGYTYEIEVNERIEFVSGHGHQALGVYINDDEGNNIEDPTQIIFRKASNGNMGITFPEDGYTYTLYPYWLNGPYFEEKTYNLDYKLAIPGKGVLDLEIIFKTVVDPIDIRDLVANQSETFMSTYYNTGVTEVNDSVYYVNLGKYRGSENPTSLNIGNNSYGTQNIPLSVGNNVFVNAPVWKIKDGNVLVALPWLAADSLPTGLTEIRVGGQLIKVNTYESDEDKYLEVVGVEVRPVVDGYTSEIVPADGNLIHFRSGHGRQALGIYISDGMDVIPTTQLIFRKDNITGYMGVTKLDDEDLYVFYPEYSDNAYTEETTRDYDFKLAVPGKGIVDLDIHFEKVVDEVSE